MYLKSIEVQGFKSFANKIVFDFHNGITGIVGPNGSGKSNVADAVRWVLGEQSAKQLRGSKMEDVIFAGTQARKPLGFAYVAITLDNSDRALNVDCDEVTVSRRVYRSGESEYLMNGNSCRLKDVNELFYDTGIGKEGYSIIGQGQIDKILSGKPEERRELFDEAAGIVKFKRRKAATVKKLESEEGNLTRINDILSELEKQVGPLEKQSEKAKEYLRLKDSLKAADVSGFVLEGDKLSEELHTLEEKIGIAKAQLDAANEQYESTRAEYEQAEQELGHINGQIELTTTLLSNTELDKGRLEGQINVYNEQIHTIEVNDKHFADRIAVINEEAAKRQAQREDFNGELVKLKEDLSEIAEKRAKAQECQDELTRTIEALTKAIEDGKNDIFDILNEKSAIKSQNQRYETMLEQFHIRKAELNSRMLRGKSEENAQEAKIAELKTQLAAVLASLEKENAALQENLTKTDCIRSEIAELTAANDKLTQSYHRERSNLESLRNITERYDGYGNSIRKIMELKNDNPGILGVIADIVKVEKKYEVAIETALGGTIQNIVTDNEQTAKDLIHHLKVNKFGRATFLPLSSINGRNTLEKEACMGEKGVIDMASNLVRVSFEYSNLAKYLLGRILVVDTIDNALAIAKKYKYSLRIVTLEGEQLSPGGSMTGGAFKNASNLLGRRREIDELKAKVTEITKNIDANKAALAERRKLLSDCKAATEIFNQNIRKLQLEINSLDLTVGQATDKKKEIAATYSDAVREINQIDNQIKEIKENLTGITDNLSELDDKNSQRENAIKELTDKLENAKQQESLRAAETENVHVQYANIEQKIAFQKQNISRIDEELSGLDKELSGVKEKQADIYVQIDEKRSEIETLKHSIKTAEAQIEDCKNKLVRLKKDRDNVTASHKNFFDKREELSQTIASLDKENFRLEAAREKNEDTYEALVNYMWEEYELTVSEIKALKPKIETSLNDIRKEAARLKNAIKALGDVNVNAIEEYKEVFERYTFLKGQRDDLIEATASLKQIIKELDEGMRAQFTAKFEKIKLEFDKVFRELFGGGRGTIELVEEEDILEAGVVIISQPPGKKLQNMMQLSGGEKALTAIALLFAIQNLKPSPFCLLDEIEAALDDSNVGRYANYLHKLTRHTQFIVITHRRGTMEAADRLYGITMQEKGVSTLVSVDLIDDEIGGKA